MLVVFFDQVENRVVDHIPIAFATMRPWHVTIKYDLSIFFVKPLCVSLVPYLTEEEAAMRKE